MTRDRSEGWVHAKRSGHRNEELLKRKIETEAKYARSFAKRLNKPGVRKVKVGGLSESSVNCVLGGKTKSKTDLRVTWTDLTTSNISIKKSRGGQVYLIKTGRFIQAYGLQFEPIPETAQRGLLLYFGEASDTREVLSSDILRNSVNSKIREYERRKGRLVWNSLCAYDQRIAKNLLGWIRGNIRNIVEMCFSRGMAKDKCNWAEFVWYKNLLGEETEDFDCIVRIAELSNHCSRRSAESVVPGDVNGGSTIHLPFGFVQWHQNSMQFHHDFDLVKSSCSVM